MPILRARRRDLHSGYDPRIRRGLPRWGHGQLWFFAASEERGLLWLFVFLTDKFWLRMFTVEHVRFRKMSRSKRTYRVRRDLSASYEGPGVPRWEYRPFCSLRLTVGIGSYHLRFPHNYAR